jgi:predicted ATPase
MYYDNNTTHFIHQKSNVTPENCLSDIFNFKKVISLFMLCLTFCEFSYSYRFLSVANLQNVYSAKVTEGNLDFDENQFKLIKLLNKISIHLVDLEASHTNNNTIEKIAITEKLTSLVEQKTGDAVDGEVSDKSLESVIEKRARGLYIFGNVGIGKTVIMDMFFENCEIKSKKRVHFHQFMLEIHQKIHLYKKDLLKNYGRELNLNLSSERDAISQVAESIAKESKLLCFDEFQGYFSLLIGCNLRFTCR